MCHRYVIDTPGLLHTSPDGSTANAVQTSKEQPLVRHNPVLPGHIYIRAPPKELKQSSFLMQTRSFQRPIIQGSKQLEISCVITEQQCSICMVCMQPGCSTSSH